MSNTRRLPVDDGIVQRQACALRDNAPLVMTTTPDAGRSIVTFTLMNPAIQPKAAHLLRLCIPVLVTLALSLFSLASLRAQFPVADDYNAMANDQVSALAVQADGKILVGGSFTILGGQPRRHLGRLKADGTLDGTFLMEVNNEVDALTIQADGKILACGSFTSLGGQPRNYLGRLDADGTLDTSFNPRANDAVNVLAMQADGKILVGGAFTALGEQPRSRIARLNADGMVDSTFNPSASGDVTSLAIQADGKILMGGEFTFLGAQSRNHLARINADGTLDDAFDPRANGNVDSLVVQADGKILVAGRFTFLGGQTRVAIGRLHADGTLDNSFNPGTNWLVNSIAIQADGKILVGGYFTTLGGQPRNNIGRLNADGTLDESFSPGAGDQVYSLAVQADGKILVGIKFALIGGQPRNGVARLNNTGPATQTLTYDGAVLTWLRGGTSPEVWRTTFERSTNGTTWAMLGAGTRVAGGWELTAGSLPPDGRLRARGYVTGGYGNGSGWFIESYRGAPVFVLQPVSWTNNAGANTSFAVATGGTGPLFYQWFKNGVALEDHGNIAGTRSTTLTLSQVLKADEGSYHVVSSNAFGSVTSRVATLTVNDPFIAQHPASTNRNAGESVALIALATGTPPLSYQWYQDTRALPGATEATLALTGLLKTDAGIYTVVASNAHGSITSTPALLTVNAATLDSSFNPAANNLVSSMAVQTDGKILLGGYFTSMGGQPRNRIARLDAGGMLDSSFNLSASGDVTSLSLDADGKILVGGNFTHLGGQLRNYIARVHADGTLDNTFDPGADGTVNSLAVQADGKVLVGGNFRSLGGQSRAYIGRLNADGTLDNAFNPGANWLVHSIALQADGKILVGGDFTTLGGQTRQRLGRLNADGTLDSAFNPGADLGVSCFAVQADGKILVGGGFTNLAGQSRNYLARLNEDGTLDSEFNPSANSFVSCLVLQADGRILVGGSFTIFGGQPRSLVGRLHADGSLDGTFNPGASGVNGSRVWVLAAQADGRILLGGSFITVNGQPRNYLARLNNTELAVHSLNHDSTSLTWLRGGTSPEVWRTIFEHSINGLNWSYLGAGERIAGGWRLTGVPVPPDGSLRARGQISGGNGDGSGWFVEDYRGLPLLNLEPASRTNIAGTTASFGVMGFSGGWLHFQWLKNGAPLVNQGKTTGANSATLTLSFVLKADEGGYSVVLSNDSGSVTSRVATLTVNDPFITQHPASTNRNAGESVMLTVTAAGTPPLSYQWYHDGVEVPGAMGSSLALQGLSGKDAGLYTAVVGNVHGSVTSTPALLTVNAATLDSSFNPGISSGVFHDARSLAVQVDGKILVGGEFTALGGQPRMNIGRLNADGTLDSTFNPGAGGYLAYVSSLALQEDGKILVGGGFTTMGGQPRDHIARLNEDGTLDNAFNPGVGGAQFFVTSLALQEDGKILVGGSFDTLGGQTRNNIGRLQADGTLDMSFSPGAVGAVRSLAVQADGRILVGDEFTTADGQTHYRIIRLNVDGTLDGTFNPEANNQVHSLALQADGKILVGGWFTTLDGEPRGRIARLSADGILDNTFNPGANNWVYSMAVQADGKILVGGGFTNLAGQARNYMARLNADGTLDNSFNSVADSWVHALAVQEDGSVLVGGSFTTLDGQPRSRIARLNNTGPATQALDYDGAAITWLRGGTSPEVWRTTFEHSVDGMNWTLLGSGERVADGWQLTGLSLPAESLLRARGHVAGGYQNASGWFVESHHGVAVIILEPASRTNVAGSTASFGVTALGTEPFSYQWFKNGEALVNADNVAGANSATLTLSPVLKADEAGYTAVLSNRVGSVTSTVATLTVIDPVIIRHPISTNRNAGGGASFDVVAQGTPPLSYQWYHDTTAMPGSTGSTLTLPDLSGADVGLYTVVVGNAHGSITSSPALLTVNAATDSTFNPGAIGNVYALAFQADGRILVGGAFTNIAGQVRSGIARLNSNGSLDSSFNPGANGTVVSLAVQADGRILMGGSFTNMGGHARSRIARFHADGSLDTSFNPGANDFVDSMVVQLDGKILVSGFFTNIAGQARNRIARLNADGTLDVTFNPDANHRVNSLAVQADGKILVSGFFTSIAGQPRDRIARLNADGMLDESFNPGASGSVSALAVQADGKILVGGMFTSIGGQTRNRIARLDADGRLDGAFNPGANGTVVSLAVQADGKILVGGGFTTLGGQTRNYLGRLNQDGTLDSSFDPGANGTVFSLMLQADGRVLAGGLFTTFGGQPRNRIARLNNTHVSTQTLSVSEDMIIWSRSGTTPEVSSALFEYSSDGMSWTLLGAGERTSGGWQLIGVTVPTNGTVRARGYVVGGLSSASTWFVETFHGAPAFIYTPMSRTNFANTTATFTATGVSSESFTYQWLKDGAVLLNAGNIAGAYSATLTLNQVFKADEGAYSVVLSNSFGSVTSTVATLTVIEPIITQHPLGAYRNAGESVTFNAAAIGTPPLSYQWYRDAAAVPEAVGTTLTLHGLAKTDAGLYTVLVSNAHGSVTSRSASLRVNAATPDVTFRPRAAGPVFSLGLQADGKILIGGRFNTVSGQGRNSIARLDADGTLDGAFNPGVNGIVYCVVVQADGKILVSGAFSTLAGQTRYYIGRLNSDGTLDSSFNPGASPTVQSLAVQADGKILVGGSFTNLAGQARRYLGRLNPDGTPDNAFNPGATRDVLSLALQGDGKILVGGGFSNVGGQLHRSISRLNADGTMDNSFNPYAIGSVYSVVVQKDGKILAGGEFSASAFGRPFNYIARLNPDGTLDGSFDPGANRSVRSLALQADGSIIVGGFFSAFRQEPRYCIARLNGDGTVDNSFNPGADYPVYSMVVQRDGKILVGGEFQTLGGQSLPAIARLNNSDPATQTLKYDGTNVTWLRGGTSPEVWSTTFEHSVNGLAWTNVGAGEPTFEGWQLLHVSLPPVGSLRARGYVTSGQYNGSGGIMETILDLAIRLRLVRDGSTAVLSWTGGQGPYQVQQSTDASQPNSWQDVGTPVQTNSISLPIGPNTLFLRVRGP